MDYYMNQYNNNMTSMNDPKRSNHVIKKKITRILLPLSVLACFFFFFFLLILSQSSSSLFFISNSYDNLVLLDFNFKFKLFTYTTERNCIFLLCNGILLLIIQSSGLISKITPVLLPSKPAPIESAAAVDRQTAKFQQKATVGKDEILEQQTQENEEVEIAAAAQSVEEEEEETGEGEEVEIAAAAAAAQFVENLEEEEDDDDQSSCEEEHGGMDVDELNKKCEDFINKMKKFMR